MPAENLLGERGRGYAQFLSILTEGRVAIAALAGEIWDVFDTWAHGGSPRWNANWKDVWNTLFWPSVLFVLARFTKVLKR